jgi:hypothetical protein
MCVGAEALHIKHAGRAEMLPGDRGELAAAYVRQGYFSSVLVAWALRGSAKGVVTAAMRTKVADELEALPAAQRELAEKAIQLAASSSEEYRNRTEGEWRANLSADVHLQDALKECLDYMTEVVAAGIETGVAVHYVGLCIMPDERSKVWSLDRPELDRLVAGIKASQDKGAGRDEGGGGPERPRIQALLAALKRVIADFEN